MGVKTVDVPRNLADRDLVPYLQKIRETTQQTQNLIREFDVHSLVLPENQNEIRLTLSGNQNDYSPAGWSSARIVYLNVTTASDLTGLDANVTQLRKTIIHVGTPGVALGLLEEKLSSAAANRIRTPTPNDVYLLLNWVQDILYDKTVARWRLV